MSIKGSLKQLKVDEGKQAAIRVAEEWHLVLEGMAEVAAPGTDEMQAVLVLIKEVRSFLTGNA